MRGNFTGNIMDSAPVAEKDGLLCNSDQEHLERWREHYQERALVMSPGMLRRDTSRRFIIIIC